MTLLARLVPKMRDGTENIAVEALGYILRETTAQETLAVFLSKHGATIEGIDRVETQVVQGPTRPDLVGFKEGRKVVQIEAKFWAALTPQQPKEYFKRLRDGATLLFVAPRSRLETLWVSLLKRLGVKGTQGHAERDVKSTAIDGKHLMLTSWAHLLDQLLNSATDATARAEIDQLRGLAKRMDESALLPLREEDLAPEIGRCFATLERLIVDAVARGKKDEFIDTRGLRPSSAQGKMGRYIRIGGAGAWFGIHIRRWTSGRFPDTPLWLRFRSWRSGSVPFDDIETALRPLMGRVPPGCFRDGQDLIVPIRPRAYTEYHEVLADVVRQLQEIADRLRGSDG